jgi:hypothetical protein
MCRHSGLSEIENWAHRARTLLATDSAKSGLKIKTQFEKMRVF